MTFQTHFLNPQHKLLDETADWLLERLRQTPEGVRSLAHLMVVTPTAQSGRALRLALARRLTPHGFLPPVVVQPMDLVVPAENSPRQATDAEIAALFLKFIETHPEIRNWTHLFRPEAFSDFSAAFALLDQLLDIWRILCGGGLLMRDVLLHPAAKAVLEEAQGDELERWHELADLETAFFDFLAQKGLRHPAECVRLARLNPKPLPDEIEAVVLPALADPLSVLCDVLERQRDDLHIDVLLHCPPGDRDRFDRWGRPLPDCWNGPSAPVLAGLDESDIVRSTDGLDLARKMAAHFPAPEAGLAQPSLALCDSTLFPEISAAFLSAGYVVQNPERNLLSQSALGRLVRELLALWKVAPEGLPWDPFVAFFRSDDVQRLLSQQEGLPSRLEILTGLDAYQNVFLPRFLPADGNFPPITADRRKQQSAEPFERAAGLVLDWLREARQERSLARFLRTALTRIFKGKALCGSEGEKEFREAASCVWQMLDALSDEGLESLALSESATLALTRRLLDAAAYSLETEAAGVVRTEGWLELAWTERDKIALAGLHEGAVPDSVVGHPFLPNRLREALALTSNATRLARDSWLLQELVVSHGPHAVRAYVARSNDRGEICRPSRLLFLCRPQDYARRVAFLFGDLGEAPAQPPRRKSARWLPRLPDEVSLPNGRLSASALETYLHSPLRYLMQYALGMNPVETKRELGFDDFGTLVHRVLERFAAQELAATQQGRSQTREAEEIRQILDGLMDQVFAPYGKCVSTGLKIQLESVRQRLHAFADIQAEWTAEGWQVAEKPEFGFTVQPFKDLPVSIRGSVDRIDCRTGEDGRPEYRLIDYKTWDESSEAASHVQASSVDELDFAEALGLPIFQVSEKKRIRLLTVQLPLYGKCLERAVPEKYEGRIVDYCYLVLGRDRENVKVMGSVCLPGGARPRANTLQIAPLVPFALQTARVAIRRILDGVFWPPRPSENKPLYDFGDLFLFSPEEDFVGPDGLPCPWLERQQRKLENLK